MRIIGLIDPSINSYNLGDQIVMNNIKTTLVKTFTKDFLIHIPAYGDENDRTEEIANKCEFLIMCGTAPICSDITFRWPLKKWQYNRKVVLLGVGANSYDVKLSSRAQDIYETNLSKDYIHSVRDNFTKNVFDQHLTINTGCPTLWDVEDVTIWKWKSENVLFTLNSSRGNFEKDQQLINFLEYYYQDIYFYAQTPNDFKYFNKLKLNKEINLIQSDLISINNFLSEIPNLDYVGARLHGGINAMNHGHRAFIMPVDNRAKEMAKDCNLPIFENNDQLIEMILNSYNLKLNLPTENIQKWLGQFDV